MNSQHRSGGHPRLAVEDVKRLRELTVGGRVRALRLRLYKTQAPFRAAIKGQAEGWEPSAAWLSGVESDSLPLTSGRRSQVARALALHPDDWHLLDGETSPPATQPALVRYAAWQSVRLALATELARSAPREDDRRRGRAVRDRLRDCLEAEPEIYEASHKRVGQLSAFSDLPEATRWLLLIEGSAMEPFLPWQPMSLEWKASRIVLMRTLAEELGLEADNECIQGIEGARKAIGLRAWFQESEPRGPESDPAGVLSATGNFWDVDERAAQIRGGDLVGSLGWGFAAGIYLASAGASTTTTSNSYSGPLAWCDPLSDPSEYRRGGVLPSSLLRLGHEAQSTSSSPAQNTSRSTGSRREAFLARLGVTAVSRDLAKLQAVYTVAGRLGTAEEWQSAEGVPARKEAATNLKTLSDSLNTWHRSQLEVQRTSSAEGKSVATMVQMLERWSSS